MSLAARGLAYVCALLVAFGGVAPWVTVGDQPAGASPVALALVLLMALAATVATATQQRLALRLLAIVAAASALAVLWTLPGFAVVETPLVGAPSASVGSGLAIIVLGGALLFVAASLPAPRPRVAPAEG